MTLKTRRILYISFIFLFLVITPLVSLYASGYKLGGGFKMEKTGILILDTKPENAKIFINDKIEQKFWKKYVNLEASYIRTPTKIKNLLPGEYFIKMEIDGYWSWQKKLTVLPGQSTYAEDVTLFKKDIPVLVEPGNFNFLLQENPNYIFLNQGTSTALFNIEHEIIVQTIENENGQKAAWSNDNKQFVINDILYNTKKLKEPKDLSSVVGKNNPKVSFLTNNSDTILFHSSTSLNTLDMKNNIVSELIKNKNISTWLQKDNLIYYIQKTDYACDLIAWDINDKNIKKQISLPVSDYSFVNPEHELINLYDNKYEILYLIDPTSPIRALKDTINNINKYAWANSNTLIYANDFEIWLYNLNSQQKTLLTRISDKIDQIIWHPSNNYVLFSTADKINILELDNRERRNITQLISLDKINNPVLSRDGEILYFLAKVGNQEGLFKLSIQ